MFHAVVPKLLLELGWSCRDRPKESHWEAPSGLLRTNSNGQFGAPYGPCRLVVLYLSGKAAEKGPVFEGSLKEINAIFGLRWRPESAFQWLRSVCRCWIEEISPYCDIGPAFRLTEEMTPIDKDRFKVVISPRLMHDVQQGAPYDLEVVKKTGRSYGTLDVYLWQRWELHARTYGSKRRAIEVLAGPRARSRANQLLRQRLARIRQCWPASPFRWCKKRKTPIAPGPVPPIVKTSIETIEHLTGRMERLQTSQDSTLTASTIEPDNSS